MSEADERKAKNLIHRYKLAIETIRRVILPEESRDKRLYYLESVIKENNKENQPRYEKFLKLKKRSPEWTDKVENAKNELLDLIREVQENELP